MWRGRRGDGAALGGDDRTGDEDNTSDFVFDFGTKGACWDRVAVDVLMGPRKLNKFRRVCISRLNNFCGLTMAHKS
jgi:hypothetical protein